MSVLQESLRESCSQVTLLQQRQLESELERESERERERGEDRSTQAPRELEVKVQALVRQGLVRMERSPSGRLDLQLVPVLQQAAQEGQGWCLVSHPTWIKFFFSFAKAPHLLFRSRVLFSPLRKNG